MVGGLHIARRSYRPVLAKSPSVGNSLQRDLELWWGSIRYRHTSEQPFNPNERGKPVGSSSAALHLLCKCFVSSLDLRNSSLTLTEKPCVPSQSHPSVLAQSMEQKTKDCEMFPPSPLLASALAERNGLNAAWPDNPSEADGNSNSASEATRLLGGGRMRREGPASLPWQRQWLSA